MRNPRIRWSRVRSRHDGRPTYTQGDMVVYCVYHESRKGELKTRPIYECRSDERLKTKPEKSTRLTYIGLLGELEHPKIKTRLINEYIEIVCLLRIDEAILLLFIMNR